MYSAIQVCYPRVIKASLHALKVNVCVRRWFYTFFGNCSQFFRFRIKFIVSSYSCTWETVPTSIERSSLQNDLVVFNSCFLGFPDIPKTSNCKLHKNIHLYHTYYIPYIIVGLLRLPEKNRGFSCFFFPNFS